jgi:rubrerythrin
MMNLDEFELEDLVLAALKSEIDTKEIYISSAESVDNFLLKDRLKFLGAEEEKHQGFFEHLYKRKFPDKELKVPDTSPVPLPEIKIVSESIPISEMLKMAMEAETAAHDFYMNLAERFTGDEATLKTIKYIAKMELGHFRLIETERTSVLEYEYFEDAWPMMHMGP